MAALGAPGVALPALRLLPVPLLKMSLFDKRIIEPALDFTAVPLPVSVQVRQTIVLAVRLHGLASSPTSDTHVRVACACEAEDAARPKTGLKPGSSPAPSKSAASAVLLFQKNAFLPIIS